MKADLVAKETLFRMISPVAMLRRGFALLYKDGVITTDMSGLTEGNILEVRTADRIIEVEVRKNTETDGDDFNL
jgi:exodeoxyribonuclease VII large subunit